MNALETALYAVLTGGSALTALLASATSVYNQQAPQGATLPYVVFQLQGGGDENKSPHRSKNLVYVVKAVTNTSLKDAGLIDVQIEGLLHGQALSVTGWTNFWLMREIDIRYVELGPGGVNYYHVGGIYRVRLAQ